MMKNNIIHKLKKDTWKGTLLPIEYTSKEYYDVNMQRTDDGFQISIQKKKFTANIRISFTKTGGKMRKPLVLQKITNYLRQLKFAQKVGQID